MCASPDNRKARRVLTALVSALFLASLAAMAQQSATPPATPATSPQPPASQAAAPARPQPRFVVVLDPAHGGTDTGARLSSQLLEKDLVLAIAAHLRAALSAHNIPVITSRESDLTIPAVNRAELANHSMAAACISLHATTSGTGVHLFTSSVTQIPNTQFLPWETAQGAYAGQSLRLSSEIDTAMTRAEIPVILGRTALEPLDSFTCPAVAVELAPLDHSGSVTPLSDLKYQNRIVAALAEAIEQWQGDWRQRP